MQDRSGHKQGRPSGPRIIYDRRDFSLTADLY